MQNNGSQAGYYSLVDLFDQDDFTEAEVFHEYTKINRRNVLSISRRVETIMRDPDLLAMMSRSWKTYPGSPSVKCPDFEVPEMTYADVVAQRRSVSSMGRNFIEDEPISFEQLSGMLRMAYGPTCAISSPNSPSDTQHLRSTTSAGALYPTEIYVVALNVTDLEPGLYHYRPIEHELERIRPGDLRSEFVNLSSYEDLCGSASAGLIMTSMIRRTLTKYQHRGYRFAMYDCGALIQSLYLSGTAMNLDTCALGGVYDDEVGDFLGVNVVEEPVMLGFLIGPRSAKPTYQPPT